MSKVIAAESLEQCAAWAPPEMQGACSAPPMVTASQLESLQKQAYQEGFASGQKDGYQAGERHFSAHIERLQQMMQTLHAPFAALDQQVEQEILLLVTALVKQLVRREIRMDPGQIIAVVREALASLPVAARGVRLHLHPEDAAVVQSNLSVSGDDRSWSIIEDPVLTRGGCKVVSENSQVDATLEARLAQLIARLLGGERESDVPRS
jgi:flagellar assembly protein FliH